MRDHFKSNESLEKMFLEMTGNGKIWTLTKVLLKLNYADFITDKKKRWAYVFSFAAILFVGFLLFGSITHAMYEGMIHLGQDQE